MFDKRKIEEEVYNSRIYNSIGDTGKKVVNNVVGAVEDVADEIDKTFSGNNDWRNPHPYNTNPQRPKSAPPPVYPPIYQKEPKVHAVKKKEQKPAKPQKPKIKHRLNALRGFLIASGFVLPFVYTPVDIFLKTIIAVGCGILTIYATDWPFRIREKKELPEVKKREIKSNTGNSELDKIINNGHEYILKLREANDLIPEEELSSYIERMENASFDIFLFIKDKPEKIPQIKRFMNYYLPTTLNLLENYQKLSTQSVKGENIIGTMKEIERMMYTVAIAFEKQLDSLFSSQAMDIGVDISVFENILEQEGLKEGNTPTIK